MIKTFISKPQEIRAVQLTVGITLDKIPANLRNINGYWEVYNPLHDSWIKLEYGDWIRIDNPNDIYPIKDDYIKAKYTEVQNEN